MGLNVVVEGQLTVQAQLQKRRVRFKEDLMLGFIGKFSVNF